MHSHIQATSLLSVSTYVEVEKTAASQRATEVRRALLRAAFAGEDDAESEASGESGGPITLEGQSGGPRQRQPPAATPRRRATDRRDDGEGGMSGPISMWA